ncbi:MAG: ketol-acid reductoisomerase [Armatimonadetes bacterium]|nr:ketol-acid reductoisomerase [Armatimonadota bacterium]
MLYESDVDPSPILGRRIAVVGYGNQGRAHALNLRDRGLDVSVGTRPGDSRTQAESDGFPALDVETVVAGADTVVLTVPDESMGQVFESSVRPALAAEAALVFAHGFALTYGLVKPEGRTCVLVSPSGPGTALRESFVGGSGLPAFIASDPMDGLTLAAAYAWAIGCARAGLIPTDFREETEADLFGEQAVLCGGMPELATAAFETLVGAGFSPEVAYIECVHQVRLLADLIARHGVAGMKRRISDTAEWGSYQVGPVVVGDEVRAAMARSLARIRSGEFAQEWLIEASSGKPRLKQKREAEGASLLEQTRRGLFPDGD